jgi:hypothetical protein
MCFDRRCLLQAVINLLISLSPLYSSATYAQTAAQRRPPRPEDVQAQLLNYYRQYPDRYIRVENHTWTLDMKTHTSYHTLTLRNSAGVAYGEIEICFTFQMGDGKTGGTQTLKVAGKIAPFQTLAVRRLAVKNTHTDCGSVTASVVRAAVYR